MAMGIFRGVNAYFYNLLCLFKSRDSFPQFLFAFSVRECVGEENLGVGVIVCGDHRKTFESPLFSSNLLRRSLLNFVPCWVLQGSCLFSFQEISVLGSQRHVPVVPFPWRSWTELRSPILNSQHICLNPGWFSGPFSWYMVQRIKSQGFHMLGKCSPSSVGF